MNEWNSCQFIGHVGTPPQTKPTQAGNMLTSFSLGVGQGKGRPTMWLFVKTMEPCEFGKKSKIKIVGRMFFEAWTKDGNQKTMWGCFANSIEVITAQKPVEEPAEDDLPF